jgi:hypothetical protein
MPDGYAAIVAADPALVARIADVLHLRAAEARPGEVGPEARQNVIAVRE